ncbi:MAG: hypothetical protein AAB217_04045, partial [Chloroflexota bacterium]
FRLKTVLARGSKPSESPADYDPAAEMRSLLARGVQLLLIHPEGSTGYDFVRTTLGPAYDEMRATDKFKVEIIPQSDHLFTLLSNQKRVLDVIQNWAGKQINPV